MNNREAKEILLRYRPGETLGDSQMGEALELARRDPQLAAWFAKQRAAQEAAAAVQPQGGAASSQPGQHPPGTNASREHIIPLTKPALVMIGVAFGVLLTVFIGYLAAPQPKDAFMSYRDRMARLVQRSYPMKIAATDQAQIREYFRTNAGPVDFTLPRSLEKLPGKGGAIFTWHNHPVALLGMEAGANTNLFLFMIKRAVFENIPVPVKPEFARVGRLLTVSWTVGDRVYLLAGPTNQTLLQNYLQ